MRPLKQMLLDLLSERGWELLAQDADTDWWAGEQWRIRSIREGWGQELIVTFLVDPQYEGLAKSEAIWAIAAAEQTPADRRAAEVGVAFARLAKGRIADSLRSFVEQLDEHRRRP